MAIVATLVYRGHDELRYLVSGNGTISNERLQKDALAGPLRQIFRAKDDGLGTIAKGKALTQGEARALVLSDGSAADIGRMKVPRAACRISGSAYVDATVDDSGKPALALFVGPEGSQALLEIVVMNRKIRATRR